MNRCLLVLFSTSCSPLPTSGWTPYGELPITTGSPAARHSGKPSSNRRALKPRVAQRRNRLVGQHAVGTAAVGDDLLRGVEFGKPRFKLAQRDVHRARQMPQGEFIRRPHVENGDRAGA